MLTNWGRNELIEKIETEDFSDLKEISDDNELMKVRMDAMYSRIKKLEKENRILKNKQAA
ncbi:MAG: hypothetical protein LBB07_01795 [Bifidobacteriaceae bacterium]|jgi:polyhydroxyalkanoate synthesis regulator phasin|nr:hypothetical protein [Bifidobacteriaceae bacterium]